MKKFLISAAAVAMLATSALAYDRGELIYMVKDNVNAGPVAINKATASTNTGLIFPAYFAGNGWTTTIKIINTKNYPVVAKLVLFDNKCSKEVKDFHIYLSGRDVFTATIKQTEEGTIIESTDDSVGHEGTNTSCSSMASADNPMKLKIDANVGYIEVIPMVALNKEEHGGKLRCDYQTFAEKVRRVRKTEDLVFLKGVVKNQVVRLPYVSLNTLNNSSDKNSSNFVNDNKNNVIGALDGYVRITDTVNGKDMIKKPIYVSFDVNNKGLVYLEGEKANLADVAIKDTTAYDANAVNASINNLSTNTVFMTYGEADPANNQLVFTSPFKRIAYQTDNTNITVNNHFEWPTDLRCDFTTRQNVPINGYKVVALIYNNSENRLKDSEFSPATTPNILLPYELSTSNGNYAGNVHNLAGYLKQAASKGYTEGMVIIRNYELDKSIPAIVTQMIATKAGDKVVTNWFDPVQR